MSESSQKLRPRKRAGRHRPRRERPAFGAAFAAGPAHGDFALAGTPQLAMPAPESTRGALVSNALSLLIHAAIFALVALTASFAPTAVEEFIEVKILEELPGSKEEPAPVAPRKLAPRRAVTARAPVPLATPRPAPVQPRVVPQARAVAPQMARIDPAAAPTELERTQVESRSVTARQAELAPRSAAIEAAAVAPIGIAPAGTTPIAVPVAQPRSVVAASPVAVAAPVAPIAATQVQGLAPTRAAPVAPTARSTEPGFDTSSEFALEDFGAGGGIGGSGSGTAIGVVPCNESAFVGRYYEEIGRRMKERWTDYPEDARKNSAVVLSFVLDASGAATQISVKRSDDPRLDAGALSAMREASPFPALDDTVRCLVGQRIKGTFTLPTDAVGFGGR